MWRLKCLKDQVLQLIICLSHLYQMFLNIDLIQFFLFLGTNDIAHHTHDPVYISNKLSDILRRLTEISAQVRFVNLERRHYPPSNHFNLRNDDYERCRRFVNQRMRRYCKWAHILTVNITSPWFYEHLNADGFHFDFEASLELKRKILYVIRRCLTQQQKQ